MRRSKWIYLSAMVLVIAAAMLFAFLDGDDDVVRYHQHREQPGEEELGSCSVCGGQNDLCTHLPIISIDTGGQSIPGNPVRDPDGTLLYYETAEDGAGEIRVSIRTYEKEGVYHHPEDEPDQTAAALFRIRGNSSRNFDKKSYRIKLVDENDPEQSDARALLGMAKGDEWSLHGPFLDKTLIRNYMWMNISAQVMGYAPGVRFCEVLIDGEYQGLYVLMETIDVSPQRVNLTEYRDGDAIFSYMVRLEPRPDAQKQIDNFNFYTMRTEQGSGIELVYPGTSSQTEAVREYVKTDFSEIERYLYSYEMAKDPDSCWEYLDLDSFVDYYILQEYLAVSDAFSASTYFYKDVRGKLHIGPVWDYNNVLDNFFTDLSESDFLLDQKGWFAPLMKSGLFVDRVISRYRELRQGVLSDAYIDQYAQEVEVWLGSAIDRNFEVWGYSFDVDQLSVDERRSPTAGRDALTLEELNPSTHEEALEWMLQYAAGRGAWLDEHIEALRQYCHPSRNASEVTD